MSAEEIIRNKLKELSDDDYKSFQCRLMPSILSEKVIGVRVPVLRNYAGEIFGSALAESFLEKLPHRYYDENNLHGFLISGIKDFDKALYEVDRFLPYVDNWATCDMMSPKVFGKQKEKLYKKALEWISLDKTYTVRYGIGTLMKHFLDDGFKPECHEVVAGVVCGEYYISMMVAWYFATALAKQPEATLPYIEAEKLDRETHNRTIRKAIESFRISEETKSYLRTLALK